MVNTVHTVIAASETAANAFSDPLTWINFGVLGLLTFGLIAGWLWPKHAVDRLIREKEKAEQQRDAMAQMLQDKLLPVVGDFVHTTQALLPILQEMHHHQRLYGAPRDPPQRRRATD